MDPKLLTSRFEAPWKNALPLFIGPFMSLECLDFGKVKIPRIETPVIARPLRKSLGNVGNTVKVNIVYDDQPVVARRNDVLFKVVSAHSIG